MPIQMQLRAVPRAIQRVPDVVHALRGIYFLDVPFFRQLHSCQRSNVIVQVPKHLGSYKVQESYFLVLAEAVTQRILSGNRIRAVAVTYHVL